jgi:hypothetical protein
VSQHKLLHPRLPLKWTVLLDNQRGTNSENELYGDTSDAERDIHDEPLGNKDTRREPSSAIHRWREEALRIGNSTRGAKSAQHYPRIRCRRDPRNLGDGFR